MNKNDCLYCSNLEFTSLKNDKFNQWKCGCENKIDYDEDGLILSKKEDCKDFDFDDYHK